MGTKNSNLGIKKTLSKSPKDAVCIQKLKHTMRFKYRYKGKEYYHTLPRKTTVHPLFLEKIRRAIETDILVENHDDTQDKAS